jgi:glycine/D-amino acid oxidase-like deaminating enzyme
MTKRSRLVRFQSGSVLRCNVNAGGDMQHVIVIGSGIVGVSVADRLSQAGLGVTIVDRGHPGPGTTGNSFAWINANEKTPRDYFELNFAGLKEHYRLDEEVGGAPWLHRGGNLDWTGDPTRYDELRRRVERLDCWGYNAKWLSAAEVNRDLEPNLRFSGPTMRVAWFPDEAWLDGPLYVKSILARAQERGAQLVSRQEVTAICPGDPGVTVSLADGTELRADAVVNAAGPSADEIARLVGRELPLAPTRGLLVRVTGDQPLLRRLVHAADVNLRPDGDNQILLHHDSVDPLIGDRSDVPINDPNCRELWKRARRVLPAIAGGKITETRVGVRPYPRDGVSCIGAVTGIPGYYEAVTHSGITLAPLIGRLLATEILTGEVDPLLPPFRPDRFSCEHQ